MGKRHPSLPPPTPREKRPPKPITKQLADLAAKKTRATKPRSLTQLQKDFIRIWATGESVYSAAAKAGYTDGGTSAYLLVKRPDVVAMYQAEKQAYEASVQMTRKRVMEGLIEGTEMAKLMSDPGAFIAGWREIGKMCGYYEPRKTKIDINVSGNVTMQKLERYDDKKLLEIIQGKVQELLTHDESNDSDED